MTPDANFFTHIGQAIDLFFANVNLTSLIKRHGDWYYAIIFVWTFLQGEIFVIFSGAAAAKGILDVKYLILVTWAGTFLGDQFTFYLGHKYGPRLVKYFPKLEPAVHKAAEKIRKYEAPFILFYRFIIGVRNISPFAIGFSGLPWKEFTAWNLLASLIAAVVLSMSGYLFGETLGKALGSTIEDAMIVTAALVFFVFTAKYIWKKYRTHHPDRH